MKPIDKKRWELLHECVVEALAEAPDGSECETWLIQARDLILDLEQEDRGGARRSS